MSFYILSPNMSLLVPTVGQEASPTWAQDINASLSIIDQHNHANGAGVPITPSGLEISADLPFLSNNAIDLRSVRFDAQASPLALGSDIGCVYVSGVDLYYNDINGNQIQITALGGVAGTPGSIGGLVAPASVTYVGATPAFVFQSNANVSADLDAGSITIRENTVAANGIKLSSPTALGAGYTLTLFSSLPGSTLPVSVSSSGNLSAAQITAAQIVPNIALVGNISATGSISAGTSMAATTSLSVGTTAVVGTGLTVSAGGAAITGNSTVTGTLGVSGQTTTATIKPNGAGNATISANSSLTATVANSAGGNPLPMVVSYQPSSNGIVMLRAIIEGNGAISSGEGFSVSHPSPGVYTITFNTAFADAPAVIASSADLGSAGNLINVNAISTTSFSMNQSSDKRWCFVVLGQRSA